MMIDGAAYYGDMALEVANAVNGSCEVFDACGTSKFLCARGLPGAEGDYVDDGVEELRARLQAIIDEYADADPPLSYDAPLPLCARE